MFTVSNDVKAEGQVLPAGRYGLPMIADPEEWTIIFSKNPDAWGSFFYDEAEDALRVKVKPYKHDYRQWLTYEFTERKPDHAVAELQWEDLAIPMTITVDNPNRIYLTRLKRDLTTVPGFSYEGYAAAARFCLSNDVDLEQGLRWADAAIAQPFVGQKRFETLSLKSQILGKLGRQEESAKLMQEAIQLPGTTAVEIHMYARQLQTEKKEKEAVEIFKLNAERHGDEWPVHVGLARAYAYSGDLQKALEHAKKALEQAPDPLNRQSLEDMIQKFSKGENIAQ